MIGLDTNVLVRYLVEDDPAQASKAAHIIETRCTEDSPGFVNRVVLVPNPAHESVLVAEGVSYP